MSRDNATTPAQPNGQPTSPPAGTIPEAKDSPEAVAQDNQPYMTFHCAPRNLRLYRALQQPDTRPPVNPVTLADSETVLTPHTFGTSPEQGDGQPNDTGNGMTEGQLTVQQVFNAEMGQASARARAFLTQWATILKYVRAMELTGTRNTEISLWRGCSPAFLRTYDSIRAARQFRDHAHVEEVLTDMATGEAVKTRRVTTPAGETTTTEEQAPDVRAAQLRLAAYDRATYGGGTTGGGSSMSVSIEIHAPRPGDPASNARPVAVSVTPAPGGNDCPASGTDEPELWLDP